MYLEISFSITFSQYWPTHILKPLFFSFRIGIIELCSDWSKRFESLFPGMLEVVMTIALHCAILLRVSILVNTAARENTFSFFRKKM